MIDDLQTRFYSGTFFGGGRTSPPDKKCPQTSKFDAAAITVSDAARAVASLPLSMAIQNKTFNAVRYLEAEKQFTTEYTTL